MELEYRFLPLRFVLQTTVDSNEIAAGIIAFRLLLSSTFRMICTLFMYCECPVRCLLCIIIHLVAAMRILCAGLEEERRATNTKPPFCHNCHSCRSQNANSCCHDFHTSHWVATRSPRISASQLRGEAPKGCFFDKNRYFQCMAHLKAYLSEEKTHGICTITVTTA